MSETASKMIQVPAASIAEIAAGNMLVLQRESSLNEAKAAANRTVRAVAGAMGLVDWQFHQYEDGRMAFVVPIEEPIIWAAPAEVEALAAAEVKRAVKRAKRKAGDGAVGFDSGSFGDLPGVPEVSAGG